MGIAELLLTLEPGTPTGCTYQERIWKVSEYPKLSAFLNYYQIKTRYGGLSSGGRILYNGIRRFALFIRTNASNSGCLP